MLQFYHSKLIFLALKILGILENFLKCKTSMLCSVVYVDEAKYEKNIKEQHTG
jgi:hypothetical protein